MIFLMIIGCTRFELPEMFNEGLGRLYEGGASVDQVDDSSEDSGEAPSQETSDEDSGEVDQD